MPVALRSFGLKLNRIHRRRTAKLIGGKFRIGGKLRKATDQLDGDLVVFLHRLASRIYVGGKANKENWRRVRRQVVTKEIPAIYNKFDATIEKDSNEVQELAFSDTSKRMIDKFQEIYPIKRKVRLSKKSYRKHVKKLNFIDSDLELKFLTGREVTEAELQNEIRKTEKLIESFESETDDRRDPAGVLVIGTGNLDDDFDLFAEGQESAGLSPVDLLAGISTFNLGGAQKSLIRSTRKAIENGWSKKTFISRSFNGLAKSPERTSLVKGAMGVMRGSHQRAAATATSLFGLFNRKKVKMLMRVTSGGRSCIACFPRGHRVSIENGENFIEDVAVGDIIYNGARELDEVAEVHCNEYEGDLIEIEFENGEKITPTPNHRIPVRRNGRKVKVRADNIRTTDELIEIDI